MNVKHLPSSATPTLDLTYCVYLQLTLTYPYIYVYPYVYPYVCSYVYCYIY